MTTVTEELQPQVLDLGLDDLAPLGRQVRIGSRLYDMRSPEALSLAEYSTLTSQEHRYTAAMQRLAKESDASAAQEAETALSAIVLLVLPDLTTEQVDSLGYLKKTKVYAFFSGRLPAIQAGLRSLQSTDLPTTPTSSPASPSGTGFPTETSS